MNLFTFINYPAVDLYTNYNDFFVSETFYLPKIFVQVEKITGLRK